MFAFQEWSDLTAGFWQGVMVGLGLLMLFALYLIARAAVRGDLPAWRAALLREIIHPLKKSRRDDQDESEME